MAFSAIAVRYNEISKHDIVIACVLKATIPAQLILLQDYGSHRIWQEQRGAEYLLLCAVNSNLDLPTVHRCCDETNLGQIACRF